MQIKLDVITDKNRDNYKVVFNLIDGQWMYI